jgi:hypothetical protein
VKDPTVRIVLDASAVLAYAEGDNIHLGETIAEVTDGGGRFGISVLTVVEARRTMATMDLEHLADGIGLLLAHKGCEVLPVGASDADGLLALLSAGAADLERAAALLEAADRGGYVVTRNPDWYRLGEDPPPVEDLPVIVV